MDDVAALARQAMVTGWAAGTANVGLVRASARGLEWVEVPTRKGDSAVTALRPTTAEDAHPRSLSAVHGLGEQPLHTDGAHLQNPPDIVVLHAAEPNGTPTLLWSEASAATNPTYPRVARPHCLSGGIFTVNSGNTRFLASAYDKAAGYRYDPGCMAPADERAHEAVAYFQSLAGSAYRHEWTATDQVLVIDNRRTLHARAAVDADDTARELTRVAYLVARR